MELKDHSYAPVCLTNFAYDANEMTGNYVNLLKITVKSPQMNLFLVDFSRFKSLGPTAEVEITYTNSAALRPLK